VDPVDEGHGDRGGAVDELDQQRVVGTGDQRYCISA